MLAKEDEPVLPSAARRAAYGPCRRKDRPIVRRMIMAVIVSVLAWAILGSVAAAATYPPKPAAPQTGAPQPSGVVIVKGVPSRPRAALSRTGTSTTVPLLALGVGSVVVGTTLVGLSRRRRAADLLSNAASP